MIPIATAIDDLVLIGRRPRRKSGWIDTAAFPFKGPHLHLRTVLPFLDFIQACVNNPALLGGVLVGGGREFSAAS